MNLNSLYGEELDNHKERIFTIHARGKVGNGSKEATTRKLHNTIINPDTIIIGKPLPSESNMIVLDVDKESHPGIIICSE